MTAADALSAPPAARPEPSAAQAAASGAKGGEHKAKSFADVLGAETSEKVQPSPAGETADKPADVAGSSDAPTDPTIAALAVQPAPLPVTPASASPAAILAGLNAKPAAEGASEIPAADGATPGAIPEIAFDTPPPALAPTSAPTPSTADANLAVGAEVLPAAPVGLECATQDIAIAMEPAVAPLAKQGTKKDVKTASLDISPDAAETDQPDPTSGAGKARPIAATAPAQPVPATATVQAPAATPAEPAMQSADASMSAPGEERASAAVEAAYASPPKVALANAKSAAAGADANGQAGAGKAVQAAAAAADAAPDLKVEAAISSLTSLSAADTLAASRTVGAETSKAAQTGAAAQSAPAAAVQVYSRMIERFDGRAQRFEIRLDPAELGRVDVRIEVGADKKVHAVLAAHDSAALSDLMRGQRALETSLRQAGIDVADGGIKFELSSDTGRNPSNGAKQGDTNGNAGNVWRNFSTMDVAVDATTAAAARPWRSSRLDLVA